VRLRFSLSHPVAAPAEDPSASRVPAIAPASCLGPLPPPRLQLSFASARPGGASPAALPPAGPLLSVGREGGAAPSSGGAAMARAAPRAGVG
jgi:hypothetical protein